MNATVRLARSRPSNNRFVTVRCVTLVPAETRMSTLDTVRHTIAILRIRWSSLSVVDRVRLVTGVLETVPSHDNCCQQSLIVDTSLTSLSAISQKENPPSRSPITWPRYSSVSCWY